MYIHLLQCATTQMKIHSVVFISNKEILYLAINGGKVFFSEAEIISKRSSLTCTHISQVDMLATLHNYGRNYT